MPSFACKTCRSEEHTSELQSHDNLVCRLLLEKKTRRKATNPGRQTNWGAPARWEAARPGEELPACLASAPAPTRPAHPRKEPIIFFLKQGRPPEFPPFPPPAALRF